MKKSFIFLLIIGFCSFLCGCKNQTISMPQQVEICVKSEQNNSVKYNKAGKEILNCVSELVFSVYEKITEEDIKTLAIGICKKHGITDVVEANKIDKQINIIIGNDSKNANSQTLVVLIN